MRVYDHVTEMERESLAGRGYGILRSIGQGAFSRVFLVQEKESGRLLGCKLCIRGDLSRREAALLQKMDHPLFPRFMDAWEEGGTHFLLLEYVCGSSLEALLERRGSFSGEQTVRVGLELAEGLRYLHEMAQPMLFRDVKPANIILRQDGRVKLLDLGCACSPGRPGSKAGTPGYGAPEQLEESAVLTPACDVYGLGRTLQAMAGQRAGRRLRRVLKVMTDKQPGRRFPDMRSVLAQLAPLERSVSRRLILPQGGLGDREIICVKNIWESMYKNS